MLKQTQKGLLVICDECGKILQDKLGRDLYFKDIKVFHLYYAYIESKGWRADKYCDVCNKWLKRIDKEKRDAIETNRNWLITLKELKNAVKFAEKYGDKEFCNTIGIGNYSGNLGNSPYVFERKYFFTEEYISTNEISYEKRVSLIDDSDDCW